MIFVAISTTLLSPLILAAAAMAAVSHGLKSPILMLALLLSPIIISPLAAIISYKLNKRQHYQKSIRYSWGILLLNIVCFIIALTLFPQ